MAKKQEEPPPLCDVKAAFFKSLEAYTGAAVSLCNAAEGCLESIGNPAIRKILTDRIAEFRRRSTGG